MHAPGRRRSLTRASRLFVLAVVCIAIVGMHAADAHAHHCELPGEGHHHDHHASDGSGEPHEAAPDSETAPDHGPCHGGTCAALVMPNVADDHPLAARAKPALPCSAVVATATSPEPPVPR
ncbi:MAG: hypothetical protein JJU45_01775 [Acidimicrobiia bacterium]|nr:hypothetical protein [Acidimicrobiia bacterium]